MKRKIKLLCVVDKSKKNMQYDFKKKLNPEHYYVLPKIF